MIRVSLIIPDAGPLISLAHAGRLDLIDVFNQPVAVLDVVRLECLRKPASPDHLALLEWFDAGGNVVHVVDTPFRALYQQALGDEASGRNRHATRGLGDAAFAWLLPNLKLIAPKGTIPLVLTEDRNLSLTLADHHVAHILSTRAWLLGLENADVIDSAAEVIEQIERHGRRLSTLNSDFPVQAGQSQSDWIDQSSSSPGRDRCGD